MNRSFTSPSISVLLCTWNNADRFAKTLEYIAACRVPEDLCWELIVVNNNCTDHTDSVVQRFTEKLPIILLHEPKQGLSRARNAGLSAARGDWILFTDDDVRPCKEWIAAYWKTFQFREGSFFFGGPVISEYEEVLFDADILELANWSVKGIDWGTQEHELENGQNFLSANWTCARQVICDLGGFDESLGLNARAGVVRTGEETDLMERLKKQGFHPWYLPEAKIWHFVPKGKMTLGHIAGRKEALGYYIGLHQMDYDMHRVPMWMYKSLVRLWLHWIQQRLSGRKAYREYIEYRLMLGKVKGLRERITLGDSYR